MLKLDIGCGGRGSCQEGFIGIDTWPLPEGKTKEEYVRMDFIEEEKLPWKDGMVDEILVLHIIEHLMPEDGEILVRKAFKLLKPNATMTITCPDLFRLCKAYMDMDIEFLGKRHLHKGQKEIWPGHTLADRLNWAIHQDTHKWAYDTLSLKELINRALTIQSFHLRRLMITDRGSTRPDHEIGFVITKT